MGGVDGVLRPGGGAHRLDESLPLLVGPDGDNDPFIVAFAGVCAVGGVLTAKDFVVTHRLPFVAVEGGIEDGGAHDRALRPNLSEFDELSLAGEIAVFKRGDGREGDQARAEVVGYDQLAVRGHVGFLEPPYV